MIWFSSAGPTLEGFVKPDLLAPGGHILSYMQASTVIAEDHPEFRVADQYFQMSGTSQATGVVSGIVALLLLDEPNLTPDQVKYRLLCGSHPATYTSGSGAMVYPVFQQGAGLVDAYDVVHSDLTESANRNLGINTDLAGISHYGGPVSAWESGNGKLTYYVRDAQGNPMDGDGYEWSGSYFGDSGFLWNDDFLWNDGFLWNDSTACWPMTSEPVALPRSIGNSLTMVAPAVISTGRIHSAASRRRRKVLQTPQARVPVKRSGLRAPGTK